jgi:hypothetical protein
MRKDTDLAELEAGLALCIPSGLSLKISHASKSNPVNSSMLFILALFFINLCLKEIRIITLTF